MAITAATLMAGLLAGSAPPAIDQLQPNGVVRAWLDEGDKEYFLSAGRTVNGGAQSQVRLSRVQLLGRASPSQRLSSNTIRQARRFAASLETSLHQHGRLAVKHVLYEPNPHEAFITSNLALLATGDQKPSVAVGTTSRDRRIGTCSIKRQLHSHSPPCSRFLRPHQQRSRHQPPSVRVRRSSRTTSRPG